MAQVELEKVSKVYRGGVRAVEGVELAVGDGELVVLAGPSGCGKSTTLRMIAGLEEITEGTIRIGGRVVNEVPPRERDVAMVFQNYALYPHMTVWRNMAFGLEMRGVGRAEIEKRVMEAAGMLGLAGVLERRPRELSGGQRQRVALGRAIVREPAAFLFDEPLSNLDAKLRIQTRGELKRLHRRLKTTTIYVTHDQEEAMTLGDRIVVMKDGKIQQAETPLRTYNRPVNRFVAGFVGMPPMNFFDGVIKSDEGRLVFEEGQAGGGFVLPVPEQLRGVMGRQMDRHAVLGIRPEHFQMRPVEQGASAELDVKLNVIEPLGRDMDVYMETPLHDHVVGRVEADAGLQVGAQVRVFVDLRKLHFFEPGDTGMNLSLTSELSHADA